MTIDDKENQTIYIASTEDQAEDERRFVERGIERAVAKRDRQAKMAMSETTAANKFVQQVYAGVEDALEAILTEAENRKGGPKPKYLDPIRRTRLHLTAELAVRVVFDAVGKKYTLTKTLKSLGKAFHAHLFAEIMQESRDGRRLIKSLETNVEKRTGQIERRRDYILRYAASKGWIADSDWDEGLSFQIGSQLYNAVREGCSLFELDKSQHDGDQHPTNRIVLTDEAQRQMDEHNILLDQLHPMFGPMMRPPRPWNLDQIGPYYREDIAKMVPVVKNMREPQRRAVDAAMRDGSMQEPLDALDFLGAVPFEVNEYVTDAIAFVCNQNLGESLPKFPALEPYERPEKLEADDFAALSKEDQINLAKEAVEVNTLNLAVKANRKVMKQHLEEAQEQLASEFSMFLPYNLDFRGRIYHVPDFGYHAADYLRALFMFAVKEPITEENDSLLCLQIANSWGNGVDKGTLDNRVAWVNDNVDWIVQCGEDFEATHGLWAKADAPFQFLAAARELRNYQLEGTGYMSGLPIALDASQSGVQIFAAASRNLKEGQLVNLTPNEQPQDFYATCLAEAKRLMAEEDLPRLKAEQAADPISEDDDDDAYQAKLKRDGKIRTIEITLANPDYNRSKIKRNSMTLGYGSEQFGFANQLREDWMSEYTKDLRRGNISEHPYGEDRGFAASIYLGNVHERAIRNVVTSVAQGMDFYQQCAAALAAEGKHFQFVAKTGFPMHQHYMKFKRSSQRVTLYNQELKHRKNTTIQVAGGEQRINKTKSVNAISANLTHCTDAAILTKAVLLCRDMGVTNMMCVHDSFATSIGSAFTMSWAIRRAFVDFFDGYCLYEDVLNQVREQLDDPDNADLPEIPAKGDLDLEGVMESDYNFC